MMETKKFIFLKRGQPFFYLFIKNKMLLDTIMLTENTLLYSSFSSSASSNTLTPSNDLLALKTSTTSYQQRQKRKWQDELDPTVAQANILFFIHK